MVGDILLFFGGALGFLLFGVALIGFTRSIARRLAMVNLTYFRDNKFWWGPPPSKTRMQWLEEASLDPSPELIWLIRGMGAIALAFALMFFVGGVSRLV